MRALAAIIFKPLHQPAAKLAAAVKRMQVKIMIFDGPPEPFNKNVVHGTATAVHAEGDAGGFKHIGKAIARKLSPLISVKDQRRPKRKNH